MTQWLSLVLDWHGIVNDASLVMMAACVFPWKKDPFRVLLWAIGMISAYAVCNGTVGFLNANHAILALPLAVLYGLYLLWMVLSVCLFVQKCLHVGARQWAVTLLFFLSDVLMVEALMTATLSRWIGNSTCISMITMLCLGLLALLYRQVTVMDDHTLSDWYWCMVSLAPILLIILTSLWAGEAQGEHFLEGCLVLVVLDITVYLLFMWVQKEMHAQMELKLDNQALAFQMHQMDNIQTVLENTRTARHEMKNNYFLIESLIQEEKYTEALQFMHEAVEPLFAREEMVSTGNRFVDMLLSQKVAECRQRGIPVALNVLLSPQLQIDQKMLCSLLFNLWDNAIEASAAVKEPEIRFSMHEVKGYLAIEIRNKINGSVLQTNPTLRTSKKDKKNHGIGIEMIRQVVRHSEGDLQIFEENEHFVVSILLTKSFE